LETPVPNLRPRHFRAVAPWLVALFAAAPALAGEAERHAQILERLAPQDRQAYVQRLVAQQQARAGVSLGADVTGPVLTAFSSGATLNIGKSSLPFKITLKATDDLSGVRSFYFYAFGPSGQQIYVYPSSGFPATSVSLTGGASNSNRFLEPGAWKFTYGYGYDGAGNYAYYDEAMLDALGNTSFTVVNASGHDVVKPQLTGGKILTHAVSLSALLPGTTDGAPYVKAKATATDAGNTALSGVQSISLYFCMIGAPNTCFYPSGHTYALGLSSATLNVGTQVSAGRGNVAGTYELRYAYIYDQAGNYSLFESTMFGGTTDFSTLFPDGTTIKLKP
jgi:hypothetical protein